LCCGASGRLQADHIVPLSKGGTTYIANIQPLCRTCNPRKRVQTIDYRKWWEGFEGAF
jgi:5-methylcytosine-specific restriction endonuclease McrA